MSSSHIQILQSRLESHLENETRPCETPADEIFVSTLQRIILTPRTCCLWQIHVLMTAPDKRNCPMDRQTSISVAICLRRLCLQIFTLIYASGPSLATENFNVGLKSVKLSIGINKGLLKFFWFIILLAVSLMVFNRAKDCFLIARSIGLSKLWMLPWGHTKL